MDIKIALTISLALFIAGASYWIITIMHELAHLLAYKMLGIKAKMIFRLMKQYVTVDLKEEDKKEFYIGYILVVKRSQHGCFRLL